MTRVRVRLIARSGRSVITETSLTKAVGQLGVAQRVLYSDSKLALELMRRAQDEISQAHNTLAKKVGYSVKE